MSQKTTSDFRPHQRAWSRHMDADRSGSADISVREAEVKNTERRSLKGIPLGGFGAGSLMFNWTGSFGPFHMKPGRYEERFPNQGAFILHYRVGDEPFRCIVLSTEHVMPAWKEHQVEGAVYHALYPKGWIVYENEALRLVMEFFSPIVAKNYKETSFPVGCFSINVENKSDSELTARITLAFPNAQYTDEDGLHHNRDERRMFEYQPGLLVRRSGLFNRSIRNENFSAVELLAGEDNPVETAGTGWCIAAEAESFTVDSWDSEGDGGDLLQYLFRKEIGGDVSLCGQGECPSAAVGMTKTISRQSSESFRFSLSWNFPLVQFGGKTVWKRRFTEYFPDARTALNTLAELSLREMDRWRVLVDSWMEPIAGNRNVPGWLRTGALNELYYMSFGGTFWENGCVTKPKEFGAREGQHLFFVMECLEYPFAETFDVRHHSSRAVRELWPELERDILLAYSDFIEKNPTGALPHDAGSPGNDPYFVFDDYYLTYPHKDEYELDTTPWSEFSPKFIQQCHSYWKHTGDDAFLNDVLPSIAKTYHFQLTTDTNGDGLSEMKSSEYRDNHLFNAVLWLGALKAILDIQDATGEFLPKEDVVSQMNLTHDAVESRLWNKSEKYYQYNEKNHVIMGDAFVGQIMPLVSGLGYVLPPQRIRDHVKAAFRYGVIPNIDYDGDGFGDVGIANIARVGKGESASTAEFPAHEDESWVGVTYLFAALSVRVARDSGDSGMEALALKTAFDTYSACWTDDVLASWFATPEAISIKERASIRATMYQRARGIWELYQAIAAVSE